MAFKFTLEGSTVDHSDIFTGVSGYMDDAEIFLKDLKLNNAKLFTDLDITGFCNKAECTPMSIEEHISIQNVLRFRSDRKKLVDALFRHLVSFSEGVVASILANFLAK